MKHGMSLVRPLNNLKIVKNISKPKLQTLRFSTITITKPDFTKIFQKSNLKNAKCSPSEFDNISTELMQKAEVKCQEIIENRIPKIESRNPTDEIKMKHNLPPYTEYNVQVDSLKSILEYINSNQTEPFNIKKTIQILEKFLELLENQETIKQLMQQIMIGGPKNAEGAKYELLEAKYICKRISLGLQANKNNNDLAFSNKLINKNSIVSAPSNFYALALPDLFTLLLHGSKRVVVIAPPQSMGFFNDIYQLLLTAGINKDTVSIFTVKTFPNDIYELCQHVDAIRMVGSTPTYQGMVKHLGLKRNINIFYSGGEVSGNPNINQGSEDNQQLFSIVKGNMGNDGELCSSASRGLQLNGDNLSPEFIRNLLIKLNEEKKDLSFRYTEKKEINKGNTIPEIAYEELPKEWWGTRYVHSEKKATNKLDTENALTHAITSENSKVIVENLAKSNAGNKYVGYTKKGVKLQPFTTNPLAVVPPTHFGSPTSFAVRGEQHGQNTLGSVFQFFRLSETAKEATNLFDILYAISKSVTESKTYDGYPLYDTQMNKLSKSGEATKMKTYTMYQAKPIVFVTNSELDDEQINDFLFQLNQSPFKHEIIIHNSNNKKYTQSIEIDTENKMEQTTGNDNEFLKKCNRPAVILSLEKDQTTAFKREMYSAGHTVIQEENIDPFELAINLLNQVSLGVGINPNDRTFKEVKKDIAIPLIQTYLKEEYHLSTSFSN